MSHPFRIQPHVLNGRMGRLIDRSKPLRFSFDGQSYGAFAGDTLASALLGAGVRPLARSLKTGRPRGLLGVGAEEPNVFVATGEGARRKVDRRATLVEVEDGLVAHSASRWSGLKAEFAAAADVWTRLSGFALSRRTSFGTPRRPQPLREAAQRRANAFGAPPQTPGRDRYERVHVSCDVLVIGGGIAGLMAALAASEGGARVLLAEQESRLGGQGDLYGGTIDGVTQIEWARRATDALARSDRALLLPRARAVGLYDQRLAVLEERLADGARLWFVRAKRIVIATGSTERPLLFAGNDRPGVILARAARAYALRYGIAPGKRGVVVTNNDDGYRSAVLLKDAGADIVKIADLRAGAESLFVDRVKTTGTLIRFGAGLAQVKADSSGLGIGSAFVGDVRTSRRMGDVEEIPCDFILMSGGETPEAQLYAQMGGRLAFDPELGAVRPYGTVEGVAVVGAANGASTLAAILDEAVSAGERFARETAGPAPAASRPPIRELDEWPSSPETFIPAIGQLAGGQEHIVDFFNDVSVAEIEAAMREGHRDPSRLERALMLGAGPDHGRLSFPNALPLIADVTRREPDDVLPSKARALASSLTLGALAGLRRGRTFAPARMGPIGLWHESNGAVMEPEGEFLKASVFPQADETIEQAVLREARIAREAAGLIDLSDLGRVEIAGPDAAAFLDGIVATEVIDLPVGRCRRVLLLDSDGHAVDEGVAVRLAETRFLLTTTAPRAERAQRAFERMRQIESNLAAFVVPVREATAHMALNGPRAREVLARLDPSFDVSAAAFGPLDMREGSVAGCPARVLRIGSAGGLSFEVLCPAGFGIAMWRAILAAGRAVGLATVGAEAFATLRAEMGFAAIGRDMEGLNPYDLSLGGLVAYGKGAFVGRTALDRAEAKRSDRAHLVGLIVGDGRIPLPVGAMIVTPTRPRRIEGRVTSSYRSAVLGRPIAFGTLEGGRERIGTLVPLVEPSGRERWAHVKPLRALPFKESAEIEPHAWEETAMFEPMRYDLPDAAQ